MKSIQSNYLNLFSILIATILSLQNAKAEISVVVTHA